MIILWHLGVSIGSTQRVAGLASWNSGMIEYWKNGFLIGLDSNY
jgi:hypothetical protein